MKKDDYLTNMMQVPPKQRINVTPFDLKTQRDAFSVSLDGLKGVRCLVLLFLKSRVYPAVAVEHQHPCRRVSSGS